MPSREVRLSADYDISDYKEFQTNYISWHDHKPIAHTRVYWGDRLMIETNSLRCFGSEPPAGQPLIGVFGDSVVQGSGDSFVRHIKIPGCHALNVGMEGMRLNHVVDRAGEMADAVPMIAAVIHPTFHNLLYNETDFLWWEAQLAKIPDFPVLAFLLLSVDINDEGLKRGYEAIYGPNYAPWGEYGDRGSLTKLRQAVDRKNNLLRRVAEKRGAIVIDLDPALAPATYADIGRNFFDPIHPRAETYPLIGRAITEQLRQPIERALAEWHKPAPQPARPAATPEPTGSYGRVYPLW